MIVLLGTGTGGFLSDFAHSQSKDSGEVTDQSTERIEADEEIVVIGRRNYTALLRESAALTEDFYMRLNAIIVDPDFEVTCETARRDNSRIRTRECKTNFHRRLWNRSTVSIIRNIVPNRDGMLLFDRWTGTIDPVEAQALALAAEFEAAILDAINTDAVLNRQFHQLLDLKVAIENYKMLGD